MKLYCTHQVHRNDFGIGRWVGGWGGGGGGVMVTGRSMGGSGLLKRKKKGGKRQKYIKVPNENIQIV